MALRDEGTEPPDDYPAILASEEEAFSGWLAELASLDLGDVDLTQPSESTDRP
jgi:hypothetical protein